MIQAFQTIGQELEDVKRQFRLQSESMREHQNNVKECIYSGSHSGMSELQKQEHLAMQFTLSNLTDEFTNLRAAHWSWDGRCHCEHVDDHEMKLLSLSEQMQFLMAKAAAPPPPTTYPAPRRGFCGAFSGEGGCGDPGDHSGGGDIPKCFAKSAGGNGECHCYHVKDLMKRVAILEVARRQSAEAEQRPPLIPGRRAPPEPAAGGGRAASDAHAAGARDGERTGDLGAPLRVRPLGLLA